MLLFHPDKSQPTLVSPDKSLPMLLFHPDKSQPMFRDVNGIIKNSLKMPESRGRIGPDGVKGQRPCGGPKGWEKVNFHTSTA